MSSNILTELFSLPPQEAWSRLFDELWTQFSGPIRHDVSDAITTERDRKCATLDNLVSGSAWELWGSFEACAPRTSQLLKGFWQRRNQGKAILVLDALSLREVPWLLEQAEARGYVIHRQHASASEIPGNTNEFAKAIGFGQRSNLANNKGCSSDFPDAWTDVSKLPFADCAAQIKADPNIIYWHEWPDSEMHDLAGENGYRTLAKSAVQQLTSDDFWSLVDKLSTGRHLVITADHGYTHSGLFPDVVQRDQVDYLKDNFKSGRASTCEPGTKPHYWVPPLTQALDTDHGRWELVLGRRKWKSQGGYPALVHGGLSLLEVAVPYIEISK